MAKKGTSDEQNEVAEIPDHLKMTAEQFDNQAGDTFGGASDILVIEEGTAAGPLTYIGHRLTDLGNKLAPVDIHEAKDQEGAIWRLPIATNFRRQAEGANLQPGDTFAVRRLEDTEKKNGVGKGGMMQMYQIKVLVRKPVAVTA